MLILITMIAIFFIAYGPIIFQEGNPLPVISGIIKLQLTSKDIVEISEKKLIQKTGDDWLLNSYLEDKGWNYRERLGAGIFYERNGEDLFFTTRMYTRYYIVHETEKSID